MSYEHILFELRDGIARLTLNRPQRFNSFIEAMHLEVRAALQSTADAQARVLVLSGSGRAFCGGQDLNERVAAISGAPMDLGQSLELYYEPLVRTLRTLPIPIIAAVNGVAAGSGANVALACDLVVAAESASFIQPFHKLGLLPDCGGTWTLPRLVGPARAMGLALLGDSLSARQAAEWGLIWSCVPDADFLPTIDNIARQLAAQSASGLAATKRAFAASWANSFEAQLALERELQRTLGRSPEYAEGVRAFMERRRADRPSSSPQ